MGYSTNLLTDPSAGTAGLGLAGADQINRNYAQMPNKVSDQLSARGFGKSGQLGSALYNTENSRLGAQSDFQSKMIDMILGRQQQGASLGMQLLNSGRGIASTTPDTSLSAGLGGLGKLLGVIGGVKQGSSGGGFSETSTPTSGLPTTGNWGDYGGEF